MHTHGGGGGAMPLWGESRGHMGEGEAVSGEKGNDRSCIIAIPVASARKKRLTGRPGGAPRDLRHGCESHAGPASVTETTINYNDVTKNLNPSTNHNHALTYTPIRM